MVDAETGAPLVYCHVYFPRLQSGTITNQDGAFDLKDVAPGDSVRISYVGYETRNLVVADILAEPRVAMTQQSIVLDETVVVSEDALLYKAVAKCRQRMLRQPEQVSKAYFHLETVSEDVPLEMMQCYYNAQTKGCHVNKLDLKNGRAGLPSPEDGYYVSLNTSKAIAMFDLTNPNFQFPGNPLQLRRNECRKQFNLVRLPSFSDAQTLHIAFMPKTSDNRYFEGELWMDAGTYALKKIVLVCTDAQLHPFKPISEQSVIRSVSFQITQTFVQEGGFSFLNHVDFSYDLQFLTRVEKELTPLDVHTQGLLYMYDRGAQFILPFFSYDERHNDYRKISFLPYDDAFWEESWGFKFSALQLKRLAWLREQGVLLNFKDVLRQSGLFLSNNVLWSENRIKLNYHPEAEIKNRLSMTVQLFLDVNETEDGMRYTSATYLDAFRSYNFMGDSDEIRCYVNMFFDLAEIARRDLLAKLESGPHTEAFARKAYQDARNDLKLTLARFTRETQYGRQRLELQKWNSEIRARLDIDNIALILG